MERTGATGLVQRLREFVRWFFTVTPEPIADPKPTLTPLKRKNATQRAKRPGAARLRAHHAGRVSVARRDKS